MIKSEYLDFDRVGWTGKTDIWNVINKRSGHILGQIKWYGGWRQYCFFPAPNCTFNKGCLEDIIRMIDLMKEDRSDRAQKGGEGE
jgi:hypothetical protein